MCVSARVVSSTWNVTVRVFDRGNHGLLESRTGYDREVQALGYYVPGFQDGLVRWIEKRARSAKRPESGER